MGWRGPQLSFIQIQSPATGRVASHVEALDWAAQGSMQPDPEHLQEWGTYTSQCQLLTTLSMMGFLQAPAQLLSLLVSFTLMSKLSYSRLCLSLSLDGSSTPSTERSRLYPAAPREATSSLNSEPPLAQHKAIISHPNHL